MRSYWRLVTLVTVLISAGWATPKAEAQDSAGQSSVLHMQRSVTTSQLGFPTFIYMYPVLDGVNSTASAQALTGTIALENYSPNFSEVLWLLATGRDGVRPAVLPPSRGRILSGATS